MDAAIFFLLVFVVYTVLLAVTLTKFSRYSQDLRELRASVSELRSVVMANSRVLKDTTSEVLEPVPDVDPDTVADLEILFNNPQIKDAVTKFVHQQ